MHRCLTAGLSVQLGGWTTGSCELLECFEVMSCVSREQEQPTQNKRVMLRMVYPASCSPSPYLLLLPRPPAPQNLPHLPNVLPRCSLIVSLLPYTKQRFHTWHNNCPHVPLNQQTPLKRCNKNVINSLPSHHWSSVLSWLFVQFPPQWSDVAHLTDSMTLWRLDRFDIKWKRNYKTRSLPCVFHTKNSWYPVKHSFTAACTHWWKCLSFPWIHHIVKYTTMWSI